MDYLAEKNVLSDEKKMEILDQNQHGFYFLFNYLYDSFEDKEVFMKHLAVYLDADFDLIDKVTLDYRTSRYIPEFFAKMHYVLPLFILGDQLTVAVYNPFDLDIIEQISLQHGLSVDFVLTTKFAIESLFTYCYSFHEHTNQETGKTGLESLVDLGLNLVESRGGSEEEILDLAGEAPIAQLVEEMIKQAVNEKASDIHIEPEYDCVKVRYRVDGILKDIMKPPKALESAIISRLKILANMDITETRKPQDGRITVEVNERDVDFRISTIRTISGEKMVMRILDKSGAFVSLEKLGLLDNNYEKLMSLIHSSSGIVIVCGPTGSGKTSTLYSALSNINTPETNIITIEDPVEFDVEGVNQIQVNHKIGLDFLSGLTSVLRQDPDVIMIGEVRDYETANISIQAALTGHLVFTTLHTRSAAGTVTRLVDMGVQPFLLNSTVNGIIGQRLLRCICENCKEKVSVKEYTDLKSKQFIQYISDHYDSFHLYRGIGCKFCDNNGYKGRTGVFEILSLTSAVREAILMKASSDKIESIAKKEGTVLMKDNAVLCVINGITSIEEVLRVLD